MTDSFGEQGEFAPAQDLTHDTATLDVQAATLDNEAATLDVAPNGFAKLGLAHELLRAVEDLGFAQPTPVQDSTIPLALGSDGEGFNDLMVSSQTGSGKTAAFLLPVLHTLIEQKAAHYAREAAEFEALVAEAAAKGEPAPKRPRRKDPTNPRHFTAATPGALVLCPTRELAQQVAHDAIDLVKHCRGVRIAHIVGGMPYQMQIARLQNADLVVATPGRLLDLQRSSQIKLEHVQFLVVDEADRMLDLGFADDLAEVNRLTADRRQTMMFSATLAPRIQQLAARVMREPRRVQIDSPQERHANIKQVLHWADHAQHKRALLDHWLRDTNIDQAIVFASTKVECDGLANDLQQAGFAAVSLHGDLSQGLRNRRLGALRNGQVQFLVATDVAARGIDVPTITHVFNFGLPMKAEDYTHRIGRTGRAGRDGLAVTFAEYRDRYRIFDIEGFTKQPFNAEAIPGLEPKQRFPSGRPNGGPGGPGGRGRSGGGFNERRGGGGGFGDRRGFGGGRPSDRHHGDRAHADRTHADRVHGDRQFADRHHAERNAFDGRGEGESYGRMKGFGNESFAKPARPGGGGKVFVPRDFAKKKPYKPAGKR